MTEKVLTAKDGSIFLQRDADRAPEYFACVDFDPLPDPSGAISLIHCRDGNNEYVTIGERQDEPDAITTTINARTFPSFDVLDRIKKCPINLYALLNDCDKKGVFTDWVRGEILYKARLSNKTFSNLGMMTATDDVLRALEFTGWGVIHLANNLHLNRQVIAETTDLNAIAVDGAAICAGACGPAQDAGEIAFIGGDAPPASATSTADLWQTVNGGQDWTNTQGGTAHPFAGGYDIAALGRFGMDRSTNRLLAVREPVVSVAMQIAYSDDDGDTWSRVTVGEVSGEGAASAKALFIRDRSLLWLATSEGNVYQSEDAGVSWTLLSGAAVASGGESLNAVRFIDNSNGYAVGDSDTLIKTDDGGSTWAAITPPTSGANLTALEVFSSLHVLVGSNADGLFSTFDAGEHWTSKTFTGQVTGVGAGTVKALIAYGELVVWMIQNPASGRGYAHRSIDGGTTWERRNTPLNSGLNDLAVIDANNLYVVGQAQAGTGFVMKVTD